MSFGWKLENTPQNEATSNLKKPNLTRTRSTQYLHKFSFIADIIWEIVKEYIGLKS